MVMRLTVAASVWSVRSEVTPARKSQGRSRAAKAGSPSQPRVSEATVMPSWLADR
jgi:hypothetical protein